MQDNDIFKNAYLSTARLDNYSILLDRKNKSVLDQTLLKCEKG